MSKIMLYAAVIFSLLSGTVLASKAPPTKQQAVSKECKYGLEDIISGLAGLKVVNVEKQSQSSDGNRIVLMVLFHDPKNVDNDSVDAMKLVVLDKNKPGEELILAVAYLKNGIITAYQREVTDETTLGKCFLKTVKPVQQKQE